MNKPLEGGQLAQNTKAKHTTCLITNLLINQFTSIINQLKDKGKEVPLQAQCGPEGSRRFRLPETSRHMKVVRSSPPCTGHLYPRECSWYSFSLGAELTPGPRYGRKEHVTEKSSDTTGNRSRDHPTGSAAP